MKIHVLGPLELWDSRQRIALPGGRLQAVLAILLLNANRAVSRDRLIEALWDGTPPPSAVPTVHSLVYRLRRAFDASSGPGEVSLGRTSSAGYMLRVTEDATDLHEFEQAVSEGEEALENGDYHAALTRLRAGLDLWRGDAFAGIEATMVRERAATLDGHRLAATELLFTAQLELGEYHAQMLSELEAAVSQHPFRERFWELLMTALYRSGRQAEALEAYQRLYKLLDEELGVQPRPAARDLHQKILAGAPDLERAAKPLTSQPVLQVAPSEQRSAGDQVPRQLPAAVSGFAGREEVLRWLDGLLPDDGHMPTAVLISVIGGMPGVGKTTLAVQWGHRIASQFPDGQLYVNLRGFDRSGQAMKPAEAVREFLEAMHVPAERLPTTLDAQAALYRSMLADRRMLIVLDNAGAAEQVRPLLPGSPGSLVVITSRDRLADLVVSHGARFLKLDLLTADEAHELLALRIGRERIEAEPEAAHDLVRLCDGLPLALAIVAARAVVNPSFRLEDLASELSASPSNLCAFGQDDSATVDLRAVFSWSYRQLRAGASRMFRFLGLHPGPDISLQAAASLAGIPVNHAETLLTELTAAHLVAEHRPGRYTLHDLLRTYAAELVRTADTEAERHEAQHRMLDHYLHSTHIALRQLGPLPGLSVDLQPPVPGARSDEINSRSQALTWIAIEHPVLVMLVEHASMSGFHTHAWQLTPALMNYFDRSDRWNEATAILQSALRSATKLGNRHAQARTYHDLGRAYLQLGDKGNAESHYHNAIDMYDRLGDRVGQAFAHGGLCSIHEGQGDYGTALDHARRALDLFQEADHALGQARALNGIGWCHALLGDYRQAKECSQRAIRGLEEVGDRVGAANAWDTLGYVYNQLGNYPKAVTCYQHALELYEETNVRLPTATTLSRLGDTHQAAGDHDASITAWNRALAIFEELNHPDAKQIREKLDT